MDIKLKYLIRQVTQTFFLNIDSNSNIGLNISFLIAHFLLFYFVVYFSA